LHVLVNIAGVGIQGPFNGVTYADWDCGLGVNLGSVEVARAAFTGDDSGPDSLHQ
jgi:hypothetical protein